MTNKIIAGLGIGYQVLQAFLILGILLLPYITIQLILFAVIGIILLSMNIASIICIYKGLSK